MRSGGSARLANSRASRSGAGTYVLERLLIERLTPKETGSSEATRGTRYFERWERENALKKEQNRVNRDAERRQERLRSRIEEAMDRHIESVIRLAAARVKAGARDD